MLILRVEARGFARTIAPAAEQRISAPGSYSMTRWLSGLVFVSCALVALVTWSEAATLYAADGATGNPSSLHILDASSGGVISIVGPIGFAVTGLAVHPITGDLYGSTANLDENSAGSLIRVDKATGHGTLIGSYGITGTLTDLTFTSDGTLYGWGQPTRVLQRVNLITGRATRVGTFNINFSTFGSGIAASADALFLAGGGGQGPLFRVDPATGVAVAFAHLDWQLSGPISAMAFGPGGLYALGISPFVADLSTTLLKVDPGTGHVTVLGPSLLAGDAIAFDPPSFPVIAATLAVPALSDLGFAVMAALLAAIACDRVRRRAARP